MKSLLIYLTILISLISCKDNTLQGDPIIVKKVVSLIPGYCTYTYEGWGRTEYFEDKCDKYNVGDKLSDKKDENVE